MKRAPIARRILTSIIASLAAIVLHAAETYQLQVVAFSLDYPSNPAAQLRTFFAPQINERGQVLFGASWNEVAGAQSNLYIGRPGAMTRVHGFKDPVPGFAGLQFGGPALYTFNAEGELLFHSRTELSDPSRPTGVMPVAGFWRGKPGSLGFVQFNVVNLPPAAGQPYFLGAASHRLSDNSTGYLLSHVETQIAGATLRVVTDGFFSAGTSSQRLIWYQGGPAPGLNGAYEFQQVGRPVVAQKNGNYVAATTVKLRGETDPSAFKTAYYAGLLDEFAPFYVQGDPLPGLPPLESFLPPLTRADDSYRLEVRGVDVVDFTGNTYLEVSARSRSTAPSIGIWKKLPEGLVPALRFNQDYPVGTATLRFSADGLTGGIAMGNGRLAFTARYTGPGVPLPQPGLFRETANGVELIAFGNMTVPGTNSIMQGDFGNVLAPLLMNERGEVVFVAHYNEPGGAPIRALWLSDEDRRLHRIIHVGQTLNIGGANRTVFRFETANHDGITPADPKLVFNNTGLLAFTVTFTDNTKAIIRAVPTGYQDPVPPVNAYWFNSKVGDNWHAMPTTNWEDYEVKPRPRPPGDADVNTAQVFILKPHSVVLDQRPASVSSVTASGRLTVRQALTVNSDSSFEDLIVSGAEASLTIKESSVLPTYVRSVQWNNSTLSLENSTLRNMGSFRAVSGGIASLGGRCAFENVDTFVKTGTMTEFMVRVPFESPVGGASVIGVHEGTLNLLNGGSFNRHGGTFIGENARLRLAGVFSISEAGRFENLLHNSPGGTLQLGTEELDATLIFSPNAKLILGVSHTTLDRGEILGGEDGSVENTGRFAWKSGRIAVGRFVNEGVIDVDDGRATRQLHGTLSNGLPNLPGASVIQRGAIDLDGAIRNYDRWTIEKSSTIAAPFGVGTITNLGRFVVQLREPGSVDIDVTYWNADSGASLHPTFCVGSSIGDRSYKHAQTRARFGGKVGNLSAGTLSRGTWIVESGCTLTFPETINRVADNTLVRLLGGEIPSLQLGKNEGIFILEQSALDTPPGGLENTGDFHIARGGTLSVQGALINRNVLQCDSEASIFVFGDFNHASGVLINNGHIQFTGAGAFRSVVFGEGKYVSVNGQELVFTDSGAFILPAGSTTTIEGSVTVTAGCTFYLQLGPDLRPRARSASDSPPRARATDNGKSGLSVTRTLTLGGALNVSLKEDFQPAADDVLILVEAGAISGQFSNAASGQRVTTTDGRGSFQVFYGEGSPHGANNVALTHWQPSPAGFPTISGLPDTQTISAGDATTLRVTASGAGPLTYQWRYRGVNIPGATNATYTVASTQREHAGAYSVVVTNSLGAAVSNLTALTVASAPPSAARLANVSTRALIREGDEPLIPGFVVQGTSNAKFLIRAVGPALNAFGVEGALPNPQITVKRLVGSGYVDHASNNDWSTNGNAADIAAAAASVGAFPLAAGALDSALLLDLAPGQYTVVASDVANRGGIGIVELYQVATTAESARLANISTRAFVGAGADVMIPGFVVSNEGARTVLVRAVGPTLGAFGVDGVLADPQLTIYQRQPDGTDIPVLSNNDWSTASDPANPAAVAARVGAFALPAGSKDAALVSTLSSGAYTIQVSGVGGTTGNALVEVYVVP